MQGTIIHVNSEKGQGLVRGEDGKRYGFYFQDWQSSGHPQVNDNIDFELDGNIAYDIILLQASTEPATTSASYVEQRTRSARPAIPTRGNEGESSISQRFFSSWAGIFAVVVLLGTFLPYLTVTGIFTAHGASSSLMATGGLVSTMLQGVDQMERTAKAFAPPGVNPATVRTALERLQGVKIGMQLSYVLYLVPLLSFWLILAKLRGKRARFLTPVHALMTLVLIIGLPLLVKVTVTEDIPEGVKQAARVFSDVFDVSFTGPGFWVMLLGALSQFPGMFMRPLVAAK